MSSRENENASWFLSMGAGTLQSAQVYKKTTLNGPSTTRITQAL